MLCSLTALKPVFSWTCICAAYSTSLPLCNNSAFFTGMQKLLSLLQGLELVFYGDSITEQWRGTDQGG